jgi:serine/threonine protein kinase
MPKASPPPELPSELANHPKFLILAELGRGGMGVVYKAQHRFMEILVALKVINKSLLDNPGALERFDREVRAAAKLDHPHIVRALDADRAGDLRILVMDFVEGANLQDVLDKKGPLPIPHACHYIRQAALGLQYAHDQGMVHRDIKPQNLILTPRGQVKILDFGLARLVSERKASGGLTRMGDFMGTPHYMAPEQALDASQADIRADLYSLACTLYSLLTGAPPFHEDTVVKLVMAHMEKNAEVLDRLREFAQVLAPFCKAGQKPSPRPQVRPVPGIASALRGTVAPGPPAPVSQLNEPPPLPGLPAPAEWDTLTEGGMSSGAARRNAEVRKRRQAVVNTGNRKKRLINGSIGVGALLLALLGLWASGVFKGKTKDVPIALENLPGTAPKPIDPKPVPNLSVVGEWASDISNGQRGVVIFRPDGTMWCPTNRYTGHWEQKDADVSHTGSVPNGPEDTWVGRIDQSGKTLNLTCEKLGLEANFERVISDHDSAKTSPPQRTGKESGGNKAAR